MTPADTPAPRPGDIVSINEPPKKAAPPKAAPPAPPPKAEPPKEPPKAEAPPSKRR